MFTFKFLFIKINNFHRRRRFRCVERETLWSLVLRGIHMRRRLAEVNNSFCLIDVSPTRETPKC